MAEFKKLSEVEQIETASDNATVLVEEGGEIKRVPKKEVGGAGIATAIIKDSNYNNAISGLQTLISEAPEVTYECINMTFEEAYQTMANGEPLAVMGMLVTEVPFNMYGEIAFTGDSIFYESAEPTPGIKCLIINFSDYVTLFWTENGISTNQPWSER